MDNALDILRKRHGFYKMSDDDLQKIVNTCAEIIVIQEQQEYAENMRKAYDEGGGCSRCGDLSGFECVCDDEEEEEDYKIVICSGCCTPTRVYYHDNNCQMCGYPN